MNAPQGFVPPDDLPSDGGAGDLDPAAALIGRWFVEGVHGEGGMLQPTLPGTDVSIVFEAGGAVFGHATVNSFRGAWELEGERLSVTELAATLMAGTSDDANDQERRFLAALGAAVGFDVAGAHHRGALELIDQHGRALIRAVRA